MQYSAGTRKHDSDQYNYLMFWFLPANTVASIYDFIWLSNYYLIIWWVWLQWVPSEICNWGPRDAILRHKQTGAMIIMTIIIVMMVIRMKFMMIMMIYCFRWRRIGEIVRSQWSEHTKRRLKGFHHHSTLFHHLCLDHDKVRRNPKNLFFPNIKQGKWENWVISRILIGKLVQV